MDTTPCPEKEMLIGYVLGTVEPNDVEYVATHVTTCAGCRQTLQTLEGLSADALTGLWQHASQEGSHAIEPEHQQAVNKHRRLRAGSARLQDRGAGSSRDKGARRVTKLGDYELITKLGQGGMGTVYKARHTRLKRVVALKVLPKDCLNNEQAVARFEREMEAVGRLDHPNIVRAMDARDVNGVRFLVMEHVEGLDLLEIVRRHGPLRIADACEIIRQAACGLQCSDQNGLVHRDVKPSNLMLNDQGVVKLLDLGLAHFHDSEQLEGSITRIGQMMGTPDYLAPEQAQESHTVDIRADVYALGCTLYHLLAGCPPFSGRDYENVLQKVIGHLRDPVPSIELARAGTPEPIVLLLEQMLTKDPKSRVASPAQVATVLAPFCEGSKLVDLLQECKRATSAPAKESASHVDTGAQRGAAIVDTAHSKLDALPPAAVEPSAGEGASPVIATRSGRRAKVWHFPSLSRRTLQWIGAGLAAVAMLTALGVIMTINTGKGTVKITLSDPAANVEVKVDGDLIELTGLDKPLRLRPGDHDLVVSGPGFETIGKSFSVKRGGRSVLTVELVPKINAEVARVRSPMTPETLHRVLKEKNPDYTGAGKFVVEDGVIVQVDLDRCGLEDLSPLRELPLRSLDCLENHIAGLEPLRGMKLQHLNVESNKVSDLSPLFGMPLNDLFCAGNPVTDLSPLRSSPMTSLCISGNGVHDLSPLANLKLNILRCPGSSITSLEPLRNMPLEILDCADTKVRDLTPLEGMQLKELGIAGLDIRDLRPLRGMPLRVLSISPRRCGDMEPLRGSQSMASYIVDGPLWATGTALSPSNFWKLWGNKQLFPKTIEEVQAALKAKNPNYNGMGRFGVEGGRIVEANLQKTDVSDLTPLRGMMLQRLHVFDNPVVDLTPLHGMRLVSLTFGGANVSDLSPIAGMPLEEINCASNPIADISALRGMPLKRLNLYDCREVHDLSPLKGMPLVELWCTDCPVRSLEPLRGMPLEFLECSGTNVTDLSPLKGMPLVSLGLSRLDSRDLSPLRDMPLQQLAISPRRAGDISFLQTKTSLTTFFTGNGLQAGDTRITAAEFWAKWGH